MSLLYIREAVGKNGRKIKVPKIRTMCYNADDRWEELCSMNGRDGLGKIVNDPRITSLGKILRKYWIDEIPQLWNVFVKHDMNLVGIRPLNETYLEAYPEDIREEILRYKPGLIPPTYTRKADNLDEHLKLIREYFAEKREHPVKADLKCFFSVLYNIIFKGMRSR